MRIAYDNWGCNEVNSKVAELLLFLLEITLILFLQVTATMILMELLLCFVGILGLIEVTIVVCHASYSPCMHGIFLGNDGSYLRG